MRDGRRVALVVGALAVGGAGCGSDHTQAWPDGVDRFGGGAGAGGAGGSGAGASGAGGSGGEPAPDAGAGASGTCEIHFAEPALGPEPQWVIGGAEVCGPSVSVDAVVTSTAEEVTLFVNDSPQTRPVSNLLARFDGVVLGNSGEQPNRLRAEATLPDGTRCFAELPATLLVDCERPSCALVGPSQAGPLAQADDLDPDQAGLQVDFAVQTEPDNQGQPVRLFVGGDIDEALSATPDDDGLARFPSVTLLDGERRRVQAECSDAIGNTTRSSVSELTVDTTACDLALVSVAGGAPTVAPRDDLDSVAEGIQINVRGVVVGDECTAVRVGPCSALPPFNEQVLAPGASFELQTTLPAQDGEVELCAQAVDAAGNPVERRHPVTVRVSPPELLILAPADGAAINQQGDDTHLADLQPESGTCEAEFRTRCSEPGASVELLDVTAAQVLVGGQAICEAGENGPSALFPSVSLPTQDDGSALSLVARQEGFGLVGESPVIQVRPDCIAPQIDWLEPSCPLSQVTSSDASVDIDPGQPGVQLRAVLNNSSQPTPSVEAFLTLVGEAPGAALSQTGDPASPEFELDLTAGTDLRYSLTACATDASGNQGCADPCQVHVSDAPAVLISTPQDGAVFGGDPSDCDPSRAGFDLFVAGYVTAPAGNEVTVALADGPEQSVLLSAEPDQNFTACVPAEEGLDQLLVVEATDTARPGRVGRATARVSIDIDDEAPPTGLALSVLAVQGRRAGQVVLGWTAVDDVDGQPLDAYALRCALTDITDEAGWDAATVRSLSLGPAAGGQPQQAVLHFPLLARTYCALRGADSGGLLTPLAATAQVELEFESTTLGGATAPQVGAAYPRKGAVPLGDVTGNGGNDFLYAGVGAAVELYQGVAPGQSGQPQVVTRFLPAQGGGGAALVPNLGVSLGGLGDVNGDGRNDFALAAGGLEGEDDGAVFVFYGRDGWPQSLELGGTCFADLCLDPPADGLGGVFGYDLTAGDFDGDGNNDLLLGHPFSNGYQGEAYVVLGGPGSGLDRPVVASLGVGAGERIRVTDSSLRGFLLTVPAARSADTFGLGSSLALTAPGLLALGAYDTLGPTHLLLVQGRTYTAGAGFQGVSLETDYAFLRSAAPFVYGRTVRAAGDVDGDGRLDLLSFASDSVDGRAELYLNPVGAGLAAPSNPLFLSNSQLATGRFFGQFIGEGYSAALGLSFALSNLDGDSAGTSEVLAGAVGKFGDAVVFAGPVTSDLDAATPGAAVRTYDSQTQQAMVPNFVGDVTGDGFPDLLLVDYDNWDATSPASDGGGGEDPPEVELRLLY